MKVGVRAVKDQEGFARWFEQTFQNQNIPKEESLKKAKKPTPGVSAEPAEWRRRRPPLQP
jgi:hypothetical protein